MHLILINFSVIMLIGMIICIKASYIRDLSDRCSHGRVIFVYLTTGMGRSDSSIAFIASNKVLNCTLRYYVNPKSYVMVLVEFPDWIPEERVCARKEGSVYMVREGNETDLCPFLEVRNSSMYHELTGGTTSLRIESSGDLNTVKVVATSMKNPEFLICQRSKEIECIYDRKVYCMNKAFMCDQQNNCGKINAFDEDPMLCNDDSRLTPGIIIFSIIMVLISCCLSISVIINLMPKRKETFVYKLNPKMTLFDNQGGHTSVLIRIQPVYLEKETSTTSKTSMEENSGSVNETPNTSPKTRGS